MAKYRMYIPFDRTNFFWVVYDNGKLITSPTKDDLKGTKLKKYNDTNICSICAEELKRDGKELTNKSILYPGNARHKVDRNGYMTEIWACHRHGSNDIRRSLTQHRMENIDPNSHNALGDNCEMLTDKLFGTKRLSDKYDKYSMLPLDHSPIPEKVSIMVGDKLVDLFGKILQTTGKIYDSINGYWLFGNLKREWNKEFDIEILWCISEDRLDIERGYIIPKKRIYDPDTHTKILGIAIVKNLTFRGCGWYEQYRITDEKFIKKANKIWKEIINSQEKEEDKMVNIKKKDFFNCTTGEENGGEDYGINCSTFKKVDNVDLVFDSRGEYLGIRICRGKIINGRYTCKKGPLAFKSCEDLEIWKGVQCAKADFIETEKGNFIQIRK